VIGLRTPLDDVRERVKLWRGQYSGQLPKRRLLLLLYLLLLHTRLHGRRLAASTPQPPVQQASTWPQRVHHLYDTRNTVQMTSYSYKSVELDDRLMPVMLSRVESVTSSTCTAHHHQRDSKQFLHGTSI